MFPLRVGLFFEYGTLNGGEFSMLACLERLHPERVACVAFCPRDSSLSREFTRIGIPVPDSFPEAEEDSIRGEAVQRLVAVHRLQLLHANSLAMGRQLGRLVPRLDVPTTSHLRDIVKLSKGAVDDLNRHAGRAAVSEATRRFHVEQGLDTERTVTLYNGVDPVRFRPRPPTGSLRREWGLPPDCRLIANIGQICLRKGQTDLAEAAVLLGAKFPAARFLFVGERHSDKAESREFDRRIDGVFADAGLLDRRLRLGFRDDIASLLNEAELVVHTARQEPLGRILLEAAASGKPIITTRVGGTPEILEDGRSALLIPPADPVACATAIERLLTAPDFAAALGAAARSRAVERFSVEESAALLESWWRQVVAQSPSLRNR